MNTSTKRRTLLLLGYLAFVVLLTLWLKSLWLALPISVALILLLDGNTFHALPGSSVAKVPKRWYVLTPLLLLMLYFLAGGFTAHPRVTFSELLLWTTFILGVALSLIWPLVGILQAPAETTSRSRMPRRVLALVVGAAWLLAFVFLVQLAVFHPLKLLPQKPPTLPEGWHVTEVELPTSPVVRGWLMRPPKPRGAVIFCHGHLLHRGQVVHFISTLTKLNVGLLACDWPGHGASDGRCALFGQLERPVLCGMYEWLMKQHPELPIGVIGVSYGGGIALQTLAEMPKLKAIWVEAPAIDLERIAENRYAHLPTSFREPTLALLRNLAWLDCGLDVMQIKALPRLAGVKVPLYLVHGEADDLVPVAGSHELIANYEGPKEALFVPGASHFSLGVEVKDYRERLERFLRRHLLGEL